MTTRMRFGTFMAPFHPAGENPTLLLDGDLALLEHMDRLGFDEAWIGEHHSAGTEVIASPEIFIATAAERTRNIRLGSGVISASYHNPLWVAERAVLLDHLTKGRFMLGLGPGALPSDAAMIGLDMPATRELLEQALDVIVRLMADEVVTFKNDRWDLREARLHLRPYTPGWPGDRRRRRRLAGRPSAGRALRPRPALDRRHHGGGVRRARPALGRDGGAVGALRRHRRPRGVASGRADAHRRVA